MDDADGQTPGPADVLVRAVAVPVTGQPPTPAWLVTPRRVAGPGTLAGVLYLHWFEPPASTQNRDEFLAEAVALAARGAVALLPDLAFPWHGDPVGDARDRAAVEAQSAAVTAAYATLLAHRAVDPARTAVVGHDYGSMYGLLLARHHPGVRAAVLMAPDATWANWFDTYWLQLPPERAAGYRDVFAGLDPVDHVGHLGDRLCLQFGGRDRFVTAETRAALTAAAPHAEVSFHDRAGHFLDRPALDHRTAWLAGRLSL